jgi:hypothetical protein
LCSNSLQSEGEAIETTRWALCDIAAHFRATTAASNSTASQSQPQASRGRS